jgi:hypothetical protein
MSVTEILEARDSLLESISSGLKEDRIRLDKLLKEFKYDRKIGRSIAASTRDPGDVKECIDSLVEVCEDQGGAGLKLLKSLCRRNIEQSRLYDVFAKALQAYSELLETLSPQEKEDLRHEPICEEMPQASNCYPFDIYSSESLKKARYVLYVMSGPGEAFFIKSKSWEPIENLNDSDFQVFLAKVFRQATPQVNEEFALRMRQDWVEEQAFILIAVEKEETTKDNICYTLHADIVTRENQKSVEVKRVDGSGFSSYTREHILNDALPEFAGQLIKEWRPTFSDLFLEIFLPNDLLLDASRIKIDSIYSAGVDCVDLSFCEVPAVLRSLNRAKKLNSFSSSFPSTAGQNPSGRLTAKWNCLERGQGKLHPVINESHLEPIALRRELSDKQMAGVMFLLDLPSSRDDQIRIISSVIDADVPMCAWFAPSDSEASSAGEDLSALKKQRLDLLKQRLNCLLECLDPRCESDWTKPEDGTRLLEGECIVKKKKERLTWLSKYLDLPRNAVPSLREGRDSRSMGATPKILLAPRHLHAMEISARQIKEMVKQSHSLIPNLLLLLDHPKRWPRSYGYKCQEGGICRSNIGL